MKKLILLLLFVPLISFGQTAESYNESGLEKYELKDYKGAIADYTKAIELDPESVYAYNNRGLSKYYLKDYNEAIEDFNKAIELDPEYVKAYSNRGNAKRYLKDYKGAIEDCNKAIELDPEDAGAYYVRGRAKSDLKDYKGAIEDYTKAIELNPDYVTAYYNIIFTSIGSSTGAFTIEGFPFSNTLTDYTIPGNGYFHNFIFPNNTTYMITQNLSGTTSNWRYAPEGTSQQGMASVTNAHVGSGCHVSGAIHYRA